MVCTSVIFIVEIPLRSSSLTATTGTVPTVRFIVLPAHGEGGDWIVKIPDAAFPRLPANELAVMGLVRDVGIEVPETRMVRGDRLDDLGAGTWPSDEAEAYMVRRFDRSVGGRVHMEDFAQVLGCFGSGEGKYQSSVETVAAIAYRG